MKTHPAVRLVAFALLLLVIPAALSTTSSAQIAVGISVRIAPPALPVYEQPLCPGPGYLWTPGYWAWDDDAGYYWVPGTWVVGSRRPVVDSRLLGMERRRLRLQ